MAEIQVTAWGTREPLKNDLSAPMHDCLWEIAQEQAVLKRMKDTGEDWKIAADKVSQQDVRTHLDVVCDDNGFKRLDGSGNGRNPNLIHTNEPIKVRIAPTELNTPAAGVTNGQPSQGAYNKAVAGEGGQGVDLNKKGQVDAWVGSIPGFPTLSEHSKAGLLTAYGRDGVDKQKLATLAGSETFRKLDPTQQGQLLALYGTPGKTVATQEVDKIAAAPVSDDNTKRLTLVGSAGFYQMDENAQKLVLDRYSNDAEFRAGLNRIVALPDFTGRNSVEQAHALDILGRYSQRQGEGYGEVKTEKRADVLVALYEQVLATPKFNLNHVDPSKKESGAQSDLINDFADNKVAELTGVDIASEADRLCEKVSRCGEDAND